MLLKGPEMHAAIPFFYRGDVLLSPRGVIAFHQHWGTGFPSSKETYPYCQGGSRGMVPCEIYFLQKQHRSGLNPGDLVSIIIYFFSVLLCCTILQLSATDDFTSSVSYLHKCTLNIILQANVHYQTDGY